MFFEEFSMFWSDRILKNSTSSIIPSSVKNNYLFMGRYCVYVSCRYCISILYIQLCVVSVSVSRHTHRLTWILDTLHSDELCFGPSCCFLFKRLKVFHTVESMERDPIAVVRITLEAYQAAVFTTGLA